MNARHLPASILAFISLSGPLTAGTAKVDVRDPFWPIGYTHAKPVEEEKVEPTVVVAPTPPPKPEPPKAKPIEDDDWTQARKTLVVSGVTRSVNPSTKEVRILIMINRKMYAPGNVLSYVYGDIRFQWRVDLRSDHNVVFVPIAAERLEPQPSLPK